VGGEKMSKLKIGLVASPMGIAISFIVFEALREQHQWYWWLVGLALFALFELIVIGVASEYN
jgi:hypothetical protein